MLIINEIHAIINEYLNKHVNVRYVIAKVESLEPLIFVSDKLTINGNKVIFTDAFATKRLSTVDTKITPSEIQYTGCAGHKADEDGIGCAINTPDAKQVRNFHIKSEEVEHTYFINPKLQVDDVVVLQRINKDYLYLGKKVSPYDVIDIHKEEEV